VDVLDDAPVGKAAAQIVLLALDARSRLLLNAVDREMLSPRP
jgi:hypothetical protein